MRFRDHADPTQFHQFFREQNFPVHVDRIGSLDEERGTKYEFSLLPNSAKP